jgi:hypothetical protein
MKLTISAHDCTDANGHAVGYIGSEDRRGWFFSWGMAEPPIRAVITNGWLSKEDKARIIASLEIEQETGVRGFARATAERVLRSYLAKR